MKAWWVRLAALACGCFLAWDGHAAVIAPELDAAMQSPGAGEEIPIIVTFHKKVDPKSFKDDDKRVRRFKLLQALKREAEGEHKSVRIFAEGRGGKKIKHLWAGRALALTACPDVIRVLASLPSVESIRLDAVIHAPTTTYVSTATPEWNISAVKAPDLWSLGFKGQGVVVANLDTGVDAQHPDLSTQWRGGTNSWYDPNSEHPTPHDADGHGTQTMSLLVGRAAGGTAIGMAPDAKWIAAKIFNDAGLSQESVIHQSLQWVLDPDGNPATDDAPDVVNLSWGLSGVNTCNAVFQAEMEALKTAGISVVLSAGNSGPSASTSVSPANNPGQMSAGSVDDRLNVSTFSSRGPSACDGGIFPTVVAPGENIVTADLSFGGLAVYTTVAGTSFAAPHVSGSMALLLSAVPTANVGDLESAVTRTAVDLGTAGPDQDSGHGLIDTLAAYEALRNGGQGAMDADGDGHPGTVDCNDQNPAVHPGEREIKYDGIDQDCNGYDLTITIAKAKYNSKKHLLVVEATSVLRANARLELVGFGPMRWNAARGLWVFRAPLPASPSQITVKGVEGQESALVAAGQIGSKPKNSKGKGHRGADAHPDEVEDDES